MGDNCGRGRQLCVFFPFGYYALSGVNAGGSRIRGLNREDYKHPHGRVSPGEYTTSESKGGGTGGGRSTGCRRPVVQCESGPKKKRIPGTTRPFTVAWSTCRGATWLHWSRPRDQETESGVTLSWYGWSWRYPLGLSLNMSRDCCWALQGGFF